MNLKDEFRRPREDKRGVRLRDLYESMRESLCLCVCVCGEKRT